MTKPEDCILLFLCGLKSLKLGKSYNGNIAFVDRPGVFEAVDLTIGEGLRVKTAMVRARKKNSEWHFGVLCDTNSFINGCAKTHATCEGETTRTQVFAHAEHRQEWPAGKGKSSDEVFF